MLERFPKILKKLLVFPLFVKLCTIAAVSSVLPEPVLPDSVLPVLSEPELPDSVLPVLPEPEVVPLILSAIVITSVF